MRLDDREMIDASGSRIPTRPLASTGLDVPVLGLGGAPLGELFEIIPETTAQDIVRSAWAGGLRLYDTAPWYGHGQSEHRMGHFLRRQPRDEFVLSTKVGRVYRAAQEASRRTPPWVGGLPFEPRFDYGYDGIMRSWEDSLIRLGLHRVDLLVIHDLDPGYHGDGETMLQHKRDLESGGYKALQELRSSGDIRGIGAGINDESMVAYFLDSFALDFLLVAMPYTLLDQAPLEDTLPACLERGVSVIIGSPFASGILATGPVEGAVYNYAPASAATLEKTRRIEAVCARHGVKLQAAALQFPLGHPAVVAVIPGATRLDHVAGNLASVTAEIPRIMWDELKHKGLLHPEAPIPGKPSEL